MITSVDNSKISLYCEELWILDPLNIFTVSVRDIRWYHISIVFCFDIILHWHPWKCIYWSFIKWCTHIHTRTHEHTHTGPIGWVCRIHRLHLTEKVRLLQKSALYMALNNLMVRLQPCRFEEWRVNLHCHCFHVHSDPEW